MSSPTASSPSVPWYVSRLQNYPYRDRIFHCKKKIAAITFVRYFPQALNVGSMICSRLPFDCCSITDLLHASICLLLNSFCHLTSPLSLRLPFHPIRGTIPSNIESTRPCIMGPFLLLSPPRKGISRTSPKTFWVPIRLCSYSTTCRRSQPICSRPQTRFKWIRLSQWMLCKSASLLGMRELWLWATIPCTRVWSSPFAIDGRRRPMSSDNL